MRRWKLSPMDLESVTRWEDYSRAKDEMFVHTDIPEAPWNVVESDDKRRARINMIAHLLSTIPVPRRAADAAVTCRRGRRPRATSGRRKEMQTYVPDHAAERGAAARGEVIVTGVAQRQAWRAGRLPPGRAGRRWPVVGAGDDPGQPAAVHAERT